MDNLERIHEDHMNEIEELNKDHVKFLNKWWTGFCIWFFIIGFVVGVNMGVDYQIRNQEKAIQMEEK